MFNSSPSAILQGALIVVLIAIALGFNLTINYSYAPLIHPLPLTLGHKLYGVPEEVHSDHDEEDRGADEPDKRDFRRQSTETLGKQPLTDKNPLTPEQQAKFDKLETERTKHEIHAQTPPKHGEYGQNVGEAGKRNDGLEDFMHPAATELQQVIWLPRDPLGLAEAEETEPKAAGIEVLTEDAEMDGWGYVELRGPLPGMRRTRCFAEK
ncbi:hypothetical protein FRC08_013196 [Ceratobasidium sp. 394]|nr:hypothetical protein FRC08_013196 [Ceratobasidium sp. 394]